MGSEEVVDVGKWIFVYMGSDWVVLLYIWEGLFYTPGWLRAIEWIDTRSFYGEVCIH